MNQKVIAKLRWLTPEDGGRQYPPAGPKYTTVARFEDQKESWQEEAWSLVIEFIEQPDASLCHPVLVSFLAEDGPDQLLQLGSTFDLMEGARRVADGVVIAREDA